MEKAMASDSNTLAWKIPWTEEPGRLQSMGSLRVGHDRATSLSLFTFMHWKRKWQPTPVFLPGESQARGSLVGCRLWGRTESDTTEATLAAAAGKLSMLQSMGSQRLGHGLETEQQRGQYLREWQKLVTLEDRRTRLDELKGSC